MAAPTARGIAALDVPLTELLADLHRTELTAGRCPVTATTTPPPAAPAETAPCAYCQWPVPADQTYCDWQCRNADEGDM